MKAILWVLFQWGAKFAVPVALALGILYLASFYFVKSLKGLTLPKSTFAWIWTLGFIEILILGVLYHLTPQFFPSIVGDFFFN